MEMLVAVDAADLALEQAIVAARDAILDVARGDRKRWWTAYELKVAARNGWSSGVMGLALRELIEDGHFERGQDLRVRLRAS